MQFAQRQRPAMEKWRPLLAAIPIGLLLGFAGPFGSYPAYPTFTRYAFWLGLTVAGVIAAIAADALVPGKVIGAGRLRMGVVALFSALPMTFVVAWTISLVQPGRFFAPEQLPVLFAAVAAVQLLIVYLIKAMDHSAAGHEADASLADLSGTEAEVLPAPFPSILLAKLPPECGSEIIALETEDHYLRVHTVQGSALILMRMTDAVGLLDRQLGAQVHRRWWVAESAVVALRAERQKLSLLLVDETLVPVGRTFSAAVKARFASARGMGSNKENPGAVKEPWVGSA